MTRERTRGGERALSVLRRVILILFAAAAGWVWIISFRSGLEKYHILFGIIGLAGIAGLLYCARIIRRQDFRGPGSRYILMSVLAAAAGLALMLVIAFAVRNDVHDNWDYGLVFQNAAAIAVGKGDTLDLDYFARYGNNALFLRLLSLFLGIVYRITGKEDVYFLLNCSVVFNCILIIISILLCNYVMAKVSSPGVGLLTEAALLLMSPFYLYATFTYSDVYGLLPSVLVMVFLGNALTGSSGQRRYVWTALAAASAVFAFLIKGTAVIFLLAAFFGICFAGEFAKKRIAFFLVYIAAAAAVYGGLSVTNDLFLKRYGVTAKLQEEKAFPAQHFLMMAMNPETAGQYHYPDVEYTMSFPGKANKKKADTEELKSRLGSMGAAGTLEHVFLKKAGYIYGTGTAGAPSYIVRKPLQENAMVRFFGGNRVFFEIALLYKVILEGLILVISVLRLAGKRDENGYILFMKISWIGMFLFFCIWESHPRYTFIFLPLVGMLAAEYISYLSARSS